MARKRREITIQSSETKNFIGIIFAIVATLILLSYFIDAPGFDLIKKYLGNATIPTFVFCVNFALRMFAVKYYFSKTGSIVGQFFSIFVVAAFSHLYKERFTALAEAEAGRGGGLLGYTIDQLYLIDIFAREGALILLIILSIVSILLIFSIPASTFFGLIAKLFKWVINLIKQIVKNLKKDKDELKVVSQKQKVEEQKEVKENKMVDELHKSSDLNTINKSSQFDNLQKKDDNPEKPKDNDLGEKTEKAKVKLIEDDIEGVLVNKELNYPNWKLPSPSLLDPYKKARKENDDVKKNADIIEQTLQSFGIKAKVVNVTIGPAVTQYSLNIALGTKVSRIANLKTDLALALAAPTGMIRIEAPIPGTSYIGIEIPNSVREIVYIKELMESNLMKSDKIRLPIAIGKGINGDDIISDLQKMPHLLIAGATGSGKSVLTHSFIVSLLMKKTPDELRFIMVDPKQVELSDYNGIPHLLTPVITDMQKVLNALKWTILEMEKRYTVLKNAHVRNIVDYNTLMGYSAMPFIVIVLDEMADVMLSMGSEVEIAIVKLAQKARATGIHLLLATQRPSVDIITGLIKANIPGRIGMSVATQIDSRVILDQIGAETLLGNGDMLFKEPDKAKPFRVQGVWVSPEEVRRIVKFIKSQATEVHYSKEIVSKQIELESSTGGAGRSNKFSDDELFPEAVRIVCSSRKGSASLLQRKLSIGYNRAARLLDELYKFNIVGPEEGSKPRKVLISDAESFLNSGNEEKSDEKTSADE